MLNGFLLSGIIRGYVLVVGLGLQFVMAQVLTKEDFGSVNTFISIVLFTTFLLSAAPTRQLVRELGAYGLQSKNLMVSSYLNASHLFLVLSFALAVIFFLLGQAWVARIIAVTGIVFASALYSAFFRGLGRYVIGNIEAGVIRMSAFIVLLICCYAIGLDLTPQWVQFLYIIAAAFGLLVMVAIYGDVRPLDRTFKAFWPYGRLPIAMTMLAGIDIFTMNYDIIITSLIFDSEVVAEVRIGQQLRSLSTLPIQIYLMFSLDKLSLALRCNIGVAERRREVRFVRIMLAISIAIAIMTADAFTEIFFNEPIKFILVIAILSGSLPIILLGPRPELNIAAASENGFKNSVIIFSIFYILIIPVFVNKFGLGPEMYFALQASLISLFYISLKKLL
ncbi:hypothetical protein RBLE17_18240 [Rhodobacteraceae bacterium LE17]|jgi:O-antigen/teichoic acid export membrane protein|nr:hypothetical protein [Rhodobacteraceae bacterium LE17]